jgi:CBS domain containing-hemolysin-like protein
VPVYSKYRSNIIGYIKIKNLIIFKFSNNKVLKNAGIIINISKLNENLTLLDAIDQLRIKNETLAIVYDE